MSDAQRELLHLQSGRPPGEGIPPAKALAIIIPLYHKNIPISDIAMEMGSCPKFVRRTIQDYLDGGGRRREKLVRRRTVYSGLPDDTEMVERKCSRCRRLFTAATRFIFVCDPCKTTIEWKSGA
jgi:hypothetical protein